MPSSPDRKPGPISRRKFLRLATMMGLDSVLGSGLGGLQLRGVYVTNAKLTPSTRTHETLNNSQKEIVVGGRFDYSPALARIHFTGFRGDLATIPAQLQISYAALPEPPIRRINLRSLEQEVSLFLNGAESKTLQYLIRLVSQDGSSIMASRELEVGPQTIYQPIVTDEEGNPLKRPDSRFPSGYQTPAVALFIPEPQKEDSTMSSGIVVMAFCDPKTGKARLLVPYHPIFYEGNMVGEISVSFPGYSPSGNIGTVVRKDGDGGLSWGEVTFDEITLRQPTSSRPKLPPGNSPLVEEAINTIPQQYLEPSTVLIGVIGSKENIWGTLL